MTTKYLVKISLDLWWWIDNRLLRGPIPERYDKHLYQKCEIIQRLVNKEIPNCKLAENNYLIKMIDRSLYKRGDTTLTYNEIKSAIHHTILKPNGSDPKSCQ